MAQRARSRRSRNIWWSCCRETTWFQLGKYTVRLGLRRDNPAFPTYLVFIGHILIGKSFSRVDEDACRWLERQQREQTFYAYSTEKLTDKPYGYTAVHHRKREKRGRGRPSGAKAQQAIKAALAGR